MPFAGDELAIYRHHTQRERAPSEPVNEALALCGRRSGKTRIAAFLAAYVAAFVDLRPFLAPGEQARILVICPDRKQARVAFGYCGAFLKGASVIAGLIERETSDVIELSNGVSIEICTCSNVSARGYAVPLAIADEAAFWYSDSSTTPDKDILDSLRFAMAQFPRSLLLMISSPWAKRGEVFRVFREDFGREDGFALVWKAKSGEMNGTLSRPFQDRQRTRDPLVASVELDAEFHPDISSAFDRERLEASTDMGVFERAPTFAFGRPATHTYRGFVDPAGGGGPDSYTAAVAHWDDKEQRAMLDALIEIKPMFNTESASEQIAEFFRRYGISNIEGDHYAGEWPAQALRKNGIAYTTSERSKSEIYLEVIALVNTGRVRLIDNARLMHQMTMLERRAQPSGKSTIDHPRNGGDDVANSACGALLRASRAVVLPGDNQIYAAKSDLYLTIAAEAAGMSVAAPRAVSGFDCIHESSTERMLRELM